MEFEAYFNRLVELSQQEFNVVSKLKERKNQIIDYLKTHFESLTQRELIESMQEEIFGEVIFYEDSIEIPNVFEDMKNLEYVIDDFPYSSISTQFEFLGLDYNELKNLIDSNAAEEVEELEAFKNEMNNATSSLQNIEVDISNSSLEYDELYLTKNAEQRIVKILEELEDSDNIVYPKEAYGFLANACDCVYDKNSEAYFSKYIDEWITHYTKFLDDLETSKSQIESIKNEINEECERYREIMVDIECDYI